MSLKPPKISNPFSSNTEEEKEVLSQRLSLYKDKLEDQWTDMKSDVATHARHAAVIGGVVLGVYALLNLVLPAADDEGEEDIYEEEIAKPASKPAAAANAGFPMASAIKSLLWTVAMSWAREKVKDFVVADKSADSESEG